MATGKSVRNHPSAMCMITCIWAFYGLPVCFVYGVTRICTCILQVPLSAHLGTVRAGANVVRAWEYPHKSRPLPVGAPY